MANYYTHFSFFVRLPNEAAQAYALNLFEQANDIYQGEEPKADFPTELLPHTEDWSFEIEPNAREGQPALWLHSENGGIDAVCAFVQHLLQKFTPDQVVTFEWSNDCDKPRPDAYGGGAVIITATEIKAMSTNQWLYDNTPN